MSKRSSDPEIVAMRRCASALMPLESDALFRAVEWIVAWSNDRRQKMLRLEAARVANKVEEKS